MLRDPFFERATKIISDAATSSPSELIRILFDEYRTKSADARETFALALIAHIATLEARRRTTPEPSQTSKRGHLP